MAYKDYLKKSFKKCLHCFVGIFFVCTFISCSDNSIQSDREEVSVDSLEHSSVVIEEYITDHGLSGEIINSSLSPAVFIHDYLVDVESIDSSIQLDIRYATKNNFVGEIMYPCEKCYLKTWLAEALAEIQSDLNKKKYRLKVFDCYRPHSVQRILWDIVKNANYVAPPSKGSMHNRGMAIDLTIIDEKGNELDMGTEYDDLASASHNGNPRLTLVQKENRDLLRKLMTSHGFRTISTEWWHFYFDRKGHHALLDLDWECD